LTICAKKGRIVRILRGVDRKMSEQNINFGENVDAEFLQKAIDEYKCPDLIIKRKEYDEDALAQVFFTEKDRQNPVTKDELEETNTAWLLQSYEEPIIHEFTKAKYRHVKTMFYSGPILWIQTEVGEYERLRHNGKVAAYKPHGEKPEDLYLNYQSDNKRWGFAGEPLGKSLMKKVNDVMYSQQMYDLELAIDSFISYLIKAVTKYQSKNRREDLLHLSELMHTNEWLLKLHYDIRRTFRKTSDYEYKFFIHFLKNTMTLAKNVQNNYIKTDKEFVYVEEPHVERFVLHLIRHFKKGYFVVNGHVIENYPLALHLTQLSQQFSNSETRNEYLQKAEIIAVKQELKEFLPFKSLFEQKKSKE